MTPTDPRLQRYFDALPEPPLPDALWRRLEQRQARRASHQRWGAGIAVALLAVIAVIPLARLDVPAPAAPQIAADDHHAPAVHAAGGALHERDGHGRLQAIDRDLQAAYARGASDAEIASLWAVRRMLLASDPSRPATPPPRPLHI